MEAILHGSEGGESTLNATGMVPKLPPDLDTILDDSLIFCFEKHKIEASHWQLKIFDLSESGF